MREKDHFSENLDNHKYIIIPTNEVGAILQEYDALNNLRPDARTITITHISNCQFADEIWVKVE